MHKEAATILTNNLDAWALYAATGDERYFDVVRDLIRIDYLWGIVDYYERAIFEGKTPVIDLPASAFDTLQYYSNRYDINYVADIPAGGSGGSITPTPIPITDLIRSGNVSVLTGTNNIVFSSPLSVSTYTINAYVIFGNGSMQNNLVFSSQSTQGFIVTDVLASGTLYYQVTVNV